MFFSKLFLQYFCCIFCKTGTDFCIIIGPLSVPSSTKCTVHPDTFTPYSNAFWCTFIPYIPSPQKLGINEGWMFIILFSNLFIKSSFNIESHPAKTIKSTFPYKHSDILLDRLFLYIFLSRVKVLIPFSLLFLYHKY